ncbi:hypothetical protein OSB04_011598 [Centaurea solstitialis]|uniref:SWIM-type domain-containing protein n=1 Tax=Centaurea solstitialis TaxID=347529 RepID=A0AA38WP99_9ASTR|nr:hypothetical protein OSB04_011598 [Centaurea solstitialis]
MESHSCTRSNKCGNKHATKGWIADVVTDKLKSDGDVGCSELRKWLMKTYNVDVPYMRVYKGKELAYADMYGNWEDSFIKIDDFREELRKRNAGSVVEIDFETKGDKKHFLRIFISLAACFKGFLAGCRPYIGLDACHLKGKFNGVLAAATSIDGNNGMFPVAYAVLESENTNSWTWFLESLKKAIGTPNGLVISSDMQKGLEIAITQVYPDVEHRECELRYKPVLDLLDGIREKLMERFDKKKRIVNKWKGPLVPSTRKSGDNRAEVKCKEKRWEVILDERKCSCRVWQVKGLPCVHAAAFIAFTREANWETYVDLYYTVDKFKEAYALEIAPMPGKDQWEHMGVADKIYPPIIKRPPGRPRKNRIIPADEPKKRHRCPRCGIYGHHERTCKNPAPLSTPEGSHETSTSKRGRGKNTKARE